VDDLPASVRQLLDQPYPAVVATTGGPDSPQCSVIWIEREGNDLSFFCEPFTVKARNLRRYPSVVVIVVDPVRTFEPGAPCYVRIRGRASLEAMNDTSFQDRLAQRYMGLTAFPHKGDYLRVRIASESWSGLGPFPDTPHGWGQ